MILRRITDGIKNQDWFVVLVEVLIVVVGIFIGLQVDDWNTERKDRIDEAIVINRLHDELLNSVNVRKFIRDLRNKDWEILSVMVDNVFWDQDNRVLTTRECQAIQRSSILTSNIAAMPSFNALMSVGRINIIQDEELKGVLIAFDQMRQTLHNMAQAFRPGTVDLPTKFPNLLILRPARESNGNFEPEVTCNVENIKKNQGFINSLLLNVDIYDAFHTSGITPIVNSIEPLHKLLDENLGLEHNEE